MLGHLYHLFIVIYLQFAKYVVFLDAMQLMVAQNASKPSL